MKKNKSGMFLLWALAATVFMGCASEQHVTPLAPISLYPEYGDQDGEHDTHWYVLDDDTPYETFSSDEHVVDHHGDPSLYWYEPSGARGLVASADPEADFNVLLSYIRERAGEPQYIDGPLNFRSESFLSTFEYATFTYVLCEFWVDPKDDPSLYALSVGPVDDGVLVLLNATYVDHLKLQEQRAWTLNVKPGQTNAIVLILVDDSQVDRYFENVLLTRDGVVIN